MNLRPLVILALLALVWATMRPSPCRAGWFYSITPPMGGQTFDVGPYNSEFGCKDWLGSALFLHPEECHEHPNDFNCRIIGNGFAYPVGFAFPVPAGAQIPSGTCFESSEPGMRQGRYFFLYTKSGGSAERWTRKNRKLARGMVAAGVAEIGTGKFFVGDTRE